jgi:uncharacterized protein YyaL (SSP411 family)
VNKLAKEKSAYLRHAAEQKIDWLPWSEEAFDRARAEGKPVFLSTGAVWCHWCHVMAKEVFENEEIARLMNELFINVKLDRDERPEIDRRYQQAVAAMGGGGGWPLSVFLTPDKEPFFGGTYFPPEDMQGRPGFKNVLKSVSDFFKTKNGDARSFAARVMEALKQGVSSPGDITELSLAEAQRSMLMLFDEDNGGFGSAPKFPMPGALEFLLRRSAKKSDPSVGRAARRTLEAMAGGGIYDQLGGGFHRYSVDEAWLVPHFEKMADDNAGLLKNYIDGYAVFGDERLRDTARGIIAFLRDVLSDPGGGFYASQDADVTPDDEGGYFTWTDDEFRKVLTNEEYEALSALLINERGEMHHDPAKKVLSVTMTSEEIGQKLGKSVDEVGLVILRGKEKLLKEREKRQAPFIDKTLYTSLNGMLIASFFHAFSVLGDEELRKFGVKSLERILKERRLDGKLMHTEDVPAALDDYVHLIDALIAGYEATAGLRYLDLADELMAECFEKFYDNKEGGFFDTESEVLGLRLKRIEDIPQPSANAVGVMLLLKLSLLTRKEEYRSAAEQTLRLFAGSAREMSVHAGAYFCAADAWFHMLTLTVEALPDSALARRARLLSGKAHAAIVYGEDKNRVVPCKQKQCYEAQSDPDSLGDYCLKL